jgi:parvulin-like peptidyl-prolyl isomerase
LDDVNRVRIALLCINILLEEELLYQEAQMMKLTVKDKAVKQQAGVQIEQLRKAFSAQTGRDATAEDVYKQLGYSNRSEIENEVKRKMLIVEMRKHIVKERSKDIPEDKISAAYDQNKESMVLPMQLHLKHISIKGYESDAADREAGIAKANKALDKIFSGQRFETVAQEFSELLDPANGSDLGLLPVGALPPFMVSTAVAMEIGDVSDVIKTHTGLHIILLVDRKESGEIPKEKALDLIRSRMGQDQERLLVREYCDHLIQGGADVHVYLELEENLARTRKRARSEDE